jgi:hypothetical protein
MRDYASDLVEQRHDIREVDPAVAVQVEGTYRFIYRNPRYLVEVEHDISKVQPPVAIEIFVDAIAVRVGWCVGVRGQRNNQREVVREDLI